MNGGEAAADDRPGPSRPLVLVGLMGSGKSTLGRRLATRLDAMFVDSDRVVEDQAGRPVAEIFAAEGEPAFRDRERAVLAEVLDRPVPLVVATGGGAVLDAGTRSLLRDRATVVWLRGAPALLASRCAGDDSRPLLAGDARAVLERLAVERSPLYAEVADHVVDIDGGDARAVLTALLAAAGADPAAPVARRDPEDDHPSRGCLRAVPDDPPTSEPVEETPT